MVYPPPFVPERFFFVPLQWTRAVTGTADLDAVHLLLSMHLERHLVAFPPEQTEAYWVRQNEEGLPNLVSHVSYRDCLETLRSRGWISNCDQADLDTPLAPSFHGCYRLSEWPHFGGFGLFYLPRKYVQHRWPALLKSNGWGVKGALMGLALLMGEQQSAPPGEMPSITASRTQIARAADRVLGNSTASPKVGSALRQLMTLGLLTEDSSRANTHNRWYTLRSDCFDKPPGWPLPQIAHRCGLSLDQDQDWISLIQTFLQVNYKPIDESNTVWQAIRRAFPYLDADIDPLTLVAELRRRAGRQSTEVRRVLKDVQERQQTRKRQHWSESDWLDVDMGLPSTFSPQIQIPIPHATRGRPQTTLLVIQCRRQRISIEDTIALLAALTVEIRQNSTLHTVSQQIVADAYDVQTQKSVRANHLHLALNFHEPFQLLFTVPNEATDSRLKLRCRLGVQFT